MVGGWIIQSKYLSTDLVELWCVDRGGNETAVKVKAEPEMPKVGDEIWWQSGKVYWDGDKRTLTKVSYSYTPNSGVEP